MLARRLLIAAGGRATFPAPLGPDVIRAAPNAGAWTEVTGPHAWHDGTRTYIGWVGGNSKPNDIEVFARLDGGGSEGPVLLADHLTEGASTDPDSHNGPAVLVRPDGYIVVAYCGHQATLMRVKVSNDPDDITAGFTVASAFSHTGVTWTYPQLSQLSAASDRIYISMRGQITSGAIGGHWQNYSDDGGATWGSEYEIYRPTTGAPLVYSAFASNGIDRIDYAVTDYASDHVGGYGLWHFYMDETGAFFKSDGTAIGGGLPMDQSDLTQIVATGGDAYPYSVSYTNDGRPVIACQSKQADPVEIFEYRWSGSAWARHDIDTSDPISPSILSLGGGCHVWNDSQRFYSAKMVDGLLQMFEFTSSDDGATWASRQVTHSTEQPNSPVYVVDNGPELAVIWFIGTLGTDSDFDYGLQGIA